MRELGSFKSSDNRKNAQKPEFYSKMKKLLLAVGVQAQLGRYVDWANYDLIDEIDKGKDPRTVRTITCSKLKVKRCTGSVTVRESMI